MEYLGGKRMIKPYRALWVGVTILGSTAGLSLVWNLSDIMNAFMAVPNLIAVLLLSGIIWKETKYYLWENHLDETDVNR